MNDITKTVEQLMAKKLKVDSIDPNKELRELGLDSLDIVELLLELEDELGVQFSSDELKSLKKVSDLYTAIKAKLKK